MNISPLHRMVKVVYKTKNEMRIEEWTLAQCIKEKIPEYVIGQLLSEQTKDDTSIISSGEKGDLPFSYQLMHEYSSSRHLKTTICIKPTGAYHG